MLKARKPLLPLAVFAAVLFAMPVLALAAAQYPPPPPPGQAPPPPAYAPAQLDQLVSRIALYPDPLLAQVLAASTYSDEIPDAAMWADEHHYLTGQALANAIQADQLPWDPSVQALLPFPSVLEMMASDMTWTSELGNAFLAQPDDVEDAVQRQRHLAYQYGYLRSNPQVVVGDGPYITIVPANPNFVVVPAYDSGVVFAAPLPGFYVGGAIHFGFGITLGAFFRPWGWGAGFDRFDWGHHMVFVNNARWGRTWVNRGAYVHPYAGVHRFTPAQRAPERHEMIPRSPAERTAPRQGARRPAETHHAAPPRGGGERGGNGRDRH